MSILQNVILRSTRALQPAATTVPIGTLYFVTDESIIERSNGTAWESYSPASVAAAITQLTGDVTAGPGSGSVAATIAAAAVTDAKLRNSGALSVIGRAANSSGVPADIAVAAASDLVLVESGSTLAFGQVATPGIVNNAVTYAKLQQVSATARILARITAGAGDVEEATLSQVLDLIGSPAWGDILFRGTAGWQRLGAGTAGNVLQTNGVGADPTWVVPSGGGSTLAKRLNRLWVGDNAITPQFNSLGWTSLSTSFTDTSSNIQAFQGHNSSAASASDAGMRTTNAQGRIGMNLIYEAIIRMNADITSQRLWCGFYQSTAMDLDVSAGSQSIAAFRYSTVAGDTGWRCVTGNNGTDEVSANIGTVTASTIYKLKIETSATDVKFYINDSLVATQSTQLPTATAALRVFCVLYTQVAAIRSFDINSIDQSGD